MLNQLAVAAVREGDRERALEIAEYSRKVMGIYQWDYSACTVAFHCGCGRKRCTPVCGAVKRNAGGIVKTVGMLGYPLFYSPIWIRKNRIRRWDA